MSRFTGPQYQGARRADRDAKRLEAEQRNEETAPARRRVNRMRAKRPKKQHLIEEEAA